jgi:hypothetical protein
MKDFDLLPRTIIPASRFREFLSGTREKTPENGRNTVIIFGGGILKVMVGSGWNWEKPATGYDHRIIASTFLPFSVVFSPDLTRVLSPGCMMNNQTYIYQEICF